MSSKTREYFDALYAKSDDPWRLGTRWYEERKRAVTVSALPHARYRRGLEIGCSTGELTAALAPRCAALLALDISSEAVARATARTRELGNVTVEHLDVTAGFPEGPFDLIVLSEVAYYWEPATLRAVVADLVAHLAEDATVVTCHWRHPVADYPQGGDEVARQLREALPLARLVSHEEEDFLLEVFSTDPRSVATQEGLA
jgi:SAM-dependent methyltransferase